MLDFADVVAINKFERRGAEDALRDVRRQLVRNREAFGSAVQDMPVFGTSPPASTTTASPRSTSTCATARRQRACGRAPGVLPPVAGKRSTGARARRSRRSGCATSPRSPTTVRGYHADTEPGRAVRRRQHLRDRRRARRRAGAPTPRARRRGRRRARLPASPRAARRAGRGSSSYSGDELVVTVRDREIRTPLTRETLSGTPVPPRRPAPHADHGELLRFLRAENLPGRSRSPPACSRSSARARTRPGCSPARATPFRTNRRFHLLVRGPAGDPAVHRVRLGHALRPRPRRAPRHLRQGRHLRASRSPPSTT